MLKLFIPESELFDSSTSEIIRVKPVTLMLEHSLLSLSKWEEKWEKPFLSDNKHTYAELIDYAKCMTISQNVDPNVYITFQSDTIQKIQEYINKPATATTITEKDNKPSKEVVTSELIYCWMTQLGIPFECQKWHLNRLITLIRVCSVKNSPPKKMSKRDTLKQYSQLNAARRKKARG